MMAAYQPHPGLPHGHPGMPNPAQQHMPQPMQMQAGVSGAPVQHVSQPGAMMGMQQGMGPAAMGGQHPMPMQAQMGGQGMPHAQAMAFGPTREQSRIGRSSPYIQLLLLQEDQCQEVYTIYVMILASFDITTAVNRDTKVFVDGRRK